MKKKLLVTLFVALMVCLFALTASAANEVTLTDGTQADLSTVFKINSNNEVTGFNSGYDKNMVTDVIFPDEIVGLEANGLFGSAANLKTITFAASDTFFISGDNIFSNCSVEKITFNPNCTVEIRKGNFSSCEKLKEITFPKFSGKISGSAFAYCSNMKATNELVLAEGLTEIGGHAFHGCTSLTGTLVFPSTLTKIQEYSFQTTGFTGFDLSKCSNLTVAGGGYGGPFTDNDYITTLDLSGCTSLTYLKNSFASDCAKLETVILPPNLETIESKALAHNYKMQSIVFPASLESVADEAFHSARRDEDLKTFTVYVQSNVIMGEKYSPFRDSSAKIEYILIGEGVTAASFKAANTLTGVTEATVVSYYNPETKATYTVGQTLSSHVIVEGYCKSVALTGEHKTDNNPCVIRCENCAVTAPKENPLHTEVADYSYKNGFDSVGVMVITCANEGCTHSETKEAPVIFECLGFSAPMDGRGELAIGYVVNTTALNNYTTATGNTVRYGVFAVLEETVGDGYVFDENGKEIDGSINAEIKSSEYAAFELKILGFTEEYQDLKIAMGAYVIETVSGVSTYSYMQASAPNDGDKYSFVTYREMA